MKDWHPIQFRRKKLEGFPNIRLFSTKLGHKTTSRVAGWEAGDRMPPVDEIDKMAEIFCVSFDTLFQEIFEWNTRHPDLFELVTEWRRIKSPEQNGLDPNFTEPQNSRGLGSSLPREKEEWGKTPDGFQGLNNGQ